MTTSPTDRDDRILEVALRSAWAGDSPDLADRLAAAPGAMRAAAAQRAAAAADRHPTGRAWLRAAVVVLGLGAVGFAVATSVAAPREPQPAHSGMQDPLPQDPPPEEAEAPDRPAWQELAPQNRAELARHVARVASVRLQAMRHFHPDPSGTTVSFYPVEGVTLDLAPRDRDALLAAIRESFGFDAVEDDLGDDLRIDMLLTAIQNQHGEAATIRSIQSVTRVELQLVDGASLVASLYLDKGRAILSWNELGNIPVPPATAGLAQLVARLEARAAQRWAAVSTPQALAALPATVRELRCRGIAAEAVAESLARLPQLRRLHLLDTAATPALLDAIDDCAELRELTLAAPYSDSEWAQRTPRSALALGPLRALRHLRTLSLTYWDLAPGELAALPGLRQLSLTRCGLEAPGLALLGGLPLDTISLRNCPTLDAAQANQLARFGAARSIEWEHFDADAGVAAIRALRTLPQLRHAVIDVPREVPDLTDELGKLQQLEVLDTSRIPLTDRQRRGLAKALQPTRVLPPIGN